jgi:hypothetical protein
VKLALEAADMDLPEPIYRVQLTDKTAAKTATRRRGGYHRPTRHQPADRTGAQHVRLHRLLNVSARREYKAARHWAAVS